LERPETAGDVHEAGRACGEFARLMDDMPPSLLHTTLPGFHATDRRFDALVAALKSDPVGRAREVEREWRLIEPLEHLARESASWAADPQLRVRVTHNDTKLNNILFDAATRRALCLVDLDTVMPGYLAYDFGDLARSALCTAEEDAQDSALVAVRSDWIEPLVQGYLSELPEDLTARERLSLARGPLWVVIELALRFLTDYVVGDRYFKVAHPEHNLQRTRVQLALLERFQDVESELRRALAQLS
jgi:Ser/Thr protein kinase RdoA (MazF antagonist)